MKIGENASHKFRNSRRFQVFMYHGLVYVRPLIEFVCRRKWQVNVFSMFFLV